MSPVPVEGACQSKLQAFKAFPPAVCVTALPLFVNCVVVELVIKNVPVFVFVKFSSLVISKPLTVEVGLIVAVIVYVFPGIYPEEGMFELMLVNAEDVLITPWHDVQSVLSNGDPVFPPGDPVLKLTVASGYSKSAIIINTLKTNILLFMFCYLNFQL